MKGQERKYKVMLVIHALGYGGAGKMIVTLANGLAQRSDLDVVLYVEEKEGDHYPLDKRVSVWQEKEFFENYYTRHFQEMIQLRKRVREINPDLVISFQTNQNALAVYATRGRRIPVIISERGDPYFYHGIVAKLKTWLINQAEGGVFQTQKARAYYGKGLQKRSMVIHNPCPTDTVVRPLWENRRNEIAYVARFDIQQKRQDVMVDAFAEVVKKHPEMKLVFYGEGEPDVAIIEEKVKQLGLSENVVFKGLVTDVIGKIKDSKLFVLSSDYEGLPNSLIEAMVAGLPCVSTDCSPGGARELIQNNVNGLITPIGDSRALADAIIYLLDHPHDADAMGERAQEIRTLLDPEKIFSEWNQYINSFIS